MQVPRLDLVTVINVSNCNGLTDKHVSGICNSGVFEGGKLMLLLFFLRLICSGLKEHIAQGILHFCLRLFRVQLCLNPCFNLTLKYALWL